jgi:hypothetical protein
MTWFLIEGEELRMVRKLTITSAALAALALLACAAVYAVAKPYQQDRILITLGLKPA